MKQPSTTLKTTKHLISQRRITSTGQRNIHHASVKEVLGKPKIGIIGYGMVGSAVGAWFKKAKKFDLKKFPNAWPDVDNCEIVFICVPTPYKKSTGYDYRAIEQTAKRLTGHKIVVLKSTVLPGKSIELQKKFPQHTWLFNPEFLRDKSAVQDFLRPDRQIVGLAGHTVKHRVAGEIVLSLLPKAPYRAITTSTEAELIKIFANAFLATKVVFSNMMYDVAELTGADYDQVRLGVGHDPRITTSMTKVLMDGYRGYSGKCFPKDVGAIIRYGQLKNHRLPLLEIADDINWKLLPKKHRHR